jgi:hypothetical protein
VVHGDATDLIERNSGLFERFVDYRQQSLQMCARRDLGHDSAEACM